MMAPPTPCSRHQHLRAAHQEERAAADPVYGEHGREHRAAPMPTTPVTSADSSDALSPMPMVRRSTGASNAIALIPVTCCLLEEQYHHGHDQLRPVLALGEDHPIDHTVGGDYVIQFVGDVDVGRYIICLCRAARPNALRRVSWRGSRSSCADDGIQTRYATVM